MILWSPPILGWLCKAIYHQEPVGEELWNLAAWPGSFSCIPSGRGWISPWEPNSLWWKSEKTNQIRKAKTVSSELALARVGHHPLHLAETPWQAGGGGLSVEEGKARGCPDRGCWHSGAVGGYMEDRHPWISEGHIFGFVWLVLGWRGVHTLGRLSVIKHILAGVSQDFRHFGLASWIYTKDSSVASCKPGLQAGWLPGCFAVDKGLVSWAGCCRLWL